MKTFSQICLTLFIILISSHHVFSQQEDSLTIPQISLLSYNAIFMGIQDGMSTSGPVSGGGAVTRVVTYYHTPLFEFRISVVLKELGSKFPMPLNVKITSPGNHSQIFPLEQDILWLDLYQVYDFQFDYSTSEYGWFTLELVSYNNLTLQQDSLISTVYDRANVYLEKENIK
jgi:hypothetical protein